MKSKILFGLLLFSASSVFAQLQIDRQLQMIGGSNSDRQISGLGIPTTADQAVNVATVQTGGLIYADETGSGNNYAIMLSPAPLSYTTGMVVNFKSSHSNTGAATLRINALAIVPIKKAVTSDLSPGDIANGQMVSVIFDGTNFQLLMGLQGAQGVAGPAGTDGSSSYTYVAYADDAGGAGFTNTFNASKDYIAIKTTTLPIGSPVANDFTGLWKNYKGAPGLLLTGTVSGNTPYWDGTQWVLNSGNIFNNGGNVGIGMTGPSNKLDVQGYIGIRNTPVLSSFHDRNGGSGTTDDIYGNIRVLRSESSLADGLHIGYGGSGGPIRFYSNSGTTQMMQLSTAGVLTVNNLGGSGTVPVYADNGGNLIKGNTISDWRLVIRDDFENGTENWVGHTAINNTTNGTFGRVQLSAGPSVGNWILTNHVTGGTSNIVLKKNYDLSTYPHTEVMVKLTFYFIDAWDGAGDNESALFGISAGASVTATTLPIIVWTDTWDYDNTFWISPTLTANMVGGASWREKQSDVQGQVKTSGSIWVHITTKNLGIPVGDESFGIDNVEVYVR